MPLTPFQRSFLINGLIAKDQIVDPATGTIWEPDGGGGGSGVDWEQKVDESGASFANWLANAGTWSSDGSIIQKTNVTTSHQHARYNTKVPFGFAVIAEVEMRLPSSGQGTGANVQASMQLGHDGAAGQNALAVTIEDGSVGEGIQIERGAFSTTKKWAMTISQDTWYKVRVVTSGPWVSVYLDGTLLGTTYADVGQVTADYLVLATYNAKADFRNIKLWTLSTGAPA